MGFDVRKLLVPFAAFARMGASSPADVVVKTENLRFVRAAVTMICCITGVGYVLWNDWFVGEWSAFFTVVNLALRFYLWNPLGDYCLHRMFHTFPKSFCGAYHQLHHIEIKRPNGDPAAETVEIWVYPVAMAMYATPYTKFATLGFLQYAWFHQLSHDLPELVPGMALHHGIHHTTSNKNHGVSFAWPDRVFGTFLAEPPKNYKPPDRLAAMIETRDAD